MKVWLIRDLEPLPTDPGDRRLMRAGMLAEALAARGHETVWFTSSFDHYQKRQRSEQDLTLTPMPNLTIEVFRGPGYRRNVSLARIRHNRDFARRWQQFAEASATKPDVLVTDIPTTEAAEVVVAFAKANGIPSVLSIRDLWPDFFADYVPAPLRLLARPLLAPLDRQARFAAAGATSVTGISEGYLEWGQRKGARPPGAPDRVFPLGYAARAQPPELEVAALLSRLGVAPGSAVASFVGSWGRTYALDLLLETAARLAGRRDLTFVVAGDADTRPALRDAFRQLPNVVVPGWLEAGEIAALLTGSAIGLLPYDAKAPQGLPNKVFEYLAYGPYQVSTLGGEIAGFYARTGAGVVASAPAPPSPLRGGTDGGGKAAGAAGAGQPPTPPFKGEAGAAVGFANAIIDALPAGVDETARAARMALFQREYSAAVIYAAMVEHIEAIAAGRRLQRLPPP